MRRGIAILFLWIFLCSFSITFSAKTGEIMENGDSIVYITAYGEKYHRSSCGSLYNSCIETTLQSAVENGYTPCQRCNPTSPLDTEISDIAPHSSQKTEAEEDTRPLVSSVQQEKKQTVFYDIVILVCIIGSGCLIISQIIDRIKDKKS